MTLSIRSSIVLCVLALALVLGCSALAGALPIAPQQARAADETGEETTTTPEDPPPVSETPTEPETTPVPEAPPPTPPVTTPPVTNPSGGGDGDAPVETPKSTPSTGGGGAVGGGGGGSSSGGSAGSDPTGASATTSPVSTTTWKPSRRPTHTSGQRDGGGGNSAGGSDRNDEIRGGSGGRDTGGDGGGAGQRYSSPAGGGAPQPTFSPQAFDEGASAVTDAASHVGEAFVEALPTAPLKKIGDQVAAHIAGAGATADGGKAQKQAADQIGVALGAALLGSAVAVTPTPAKESAVPFFDPPGGGSGTIYLVLIGALLLAVVALIFREARSALGWGGPRAGPPVVLGRPLNPVRERIGAALASLQEAPHRWFIRVRRLPASAAAGLRSLF